MLSKKLLLFLFTLLFFNAYAQKTVAGKIILINNDTLNTKIEVSTYALNPKLINELSINRSITIVDEKMKKREYNASVIKEMKFIDFYEKERKFIPYKKSLVEVLIDGKIKLCMEFNPSAKDGTLVKDEFILNENNEHIPFSTLNNRRKKLKEATKNKPELASKIDKMKMKMENIKDIFDEYNEVDKTKTSTKELSNKIINNKEKENSDLILKGESSEKIDINNNKRELESKSENISNSKPNVYNEKDPVERLRKLKLLLDENIITQEEFDAKKKEILSDF